MGRDANQSNAKAALLPHVQKDTLDLGKFFYYKKFSTMCLVLIFISNQRENCSAATSPATVTLQKTQANSILRQLGKQTCVSSPHTQSESAEQLGCKPDWWRKRMQGSISADLLGIWTHSLKWAHRGHCEEMGLGQNTTAKINLPSASAECFNTWFSGGLYIIQDRMWIAELIGAKSRRWLMEIHLLQEFQKL